MERRQEQAGIPAALSTLHRVTACRRPVAIVG
jgi:hypothetical protein